MTPPTTEVRDTHTKSRQTHIPWDDWHDFKHAAKAAGAGRDLPPRQRDRAARVRQFITWYLRRKGATLPERPPVEEWIDAARADTEEPLNKNLARQIRIGADWIDFGHACRADGRDRAEVIRQFVAWYLHRDGATLPSRPPLRSWAGDAPLQDDRHDLEYAARAAGAEPDEVIRQFIAWYLRRPAAPAVKRPPLDAWVDEARAAATQRTEETDRKAE